MNSWLAVSDTFNLNYASRVKLIQDRHPSDSSRPLGGSVNLLKLTGKTSQKQLRSCSASL